MAKPKLLFLIFIEKICQNICSCQNLPYICNRFTEQAHSLQALMAELVDALDSKSSSFGSVGSIPTLSTNLALCEVFFMASLQRNPY